MKSVGFPSALGAALLCAAQVNAQSANCNNILKPSYSAPVVGGGWIAQLIVSNLTAPRGIIQDSSGHTLVVEKGVGIRSLTFTDNGGTCLEVSGSRSVIENPDLTHGIAFSNDGKTLFASTSDEVLAWTYDAATGTISGDQRSIINNMGGQDHVTRTLLMSSNNKLVVSRGSTENLDDRASTISTGVSQIRSFDMDSLPETTLDYATSGTMLGWGLRNSVGIAEEPTTHGIFSVENSVDEITRDGTDIHQDNPGEEMNFHGFLNGSTDHQGGNYGYPGCFALWDTNIPDVGTMVVGSQFPQTQNSTLNDTTCNDDRTPPRLTWQAHMAPLDILFNANGTEAYVTFHGSWDRDNPVGYKLSSVAFANGQPVEGPTSTTSLSDILSNADNSACPDKCFRPVGLVFDAQSRLFMTSDATGEIYVLVKAEIAALGSPTASGTLVTPSATASGNAAPHAHGLGAGAYVGRGGEAAWGLGLTVLACFVTGFGTLAVLPFHEPYARSY